MLITWDRILTFMIPAGSLLMTNHAQDVIFTSEPKHKKAWCFGLMPGSYIYHKFSQKPAQFEDIIEYWTAVAYSVRYVELCEPPHGRIPNSPTSALICLKLFQPAFISTFVDVPSKDLE